MHIFTVQYMYTPLKFNMDTIGCPPKKILYFHVSYLFQTRQASWEQNTHPTLKNGTLDAILGIRYYLASAKKTFKGNLAENQNSRPPRKKTKFVDDEIPLM